MTKGKSYGSGKLTNCSITLRLANEGDMSLIMAWRSSPLVYQGFYSQKEPLSWEEHEAWWKSRNSDWREFIIELHKKGTTRPIGVVSIGQLDHWTPEIGYLIGNPNDWGHGYGIEAVTQSLDWIKDYGKEYCHTTVLQRNRRSLRLLLNLGFQEVAEAREGEVWLTKKL